MIDYVQWLDEYENNAFKVLVVIEKKKKQLRTASSNVDINRLKDSIRLYQDLYRDLLAIVRLLYRRSIKYDS